MLLKGGSIKKIIIVGILNMFLLSMFTGLTVDIETDIKGNILNDMDGLKNQKPTLIFDSMENYANEKQYISGSYNKTSHFQLVSNVNNNQKKEKFNENYWNIIVPDDHATIQEAIDHAKSGNRIYVRSGTYNEYIVIDKSIILQGENKDSTIINGDDEHDVVTFDCGYNCFSGFTIKEGENGINIDASCMNSINNNIIENNNENGIILFRSYVNTIEENIIEQNNENGIQFDSCFVNLIYNNQIISNKKDGINIDGLSRGNSISKNEIQYCDYGVKINDKSEKNQIKYNYFSNNEMNAYDPSNNFWDDTYNRGNYWDDYTGLDSDNDGIGDSPYRISGGDNVDHYPILSALLQDLTYSYEYQIKRDINDTENKEMIYGSFSTITVPDDYPSIQGAIDAANIGDMINVKRGVYDETIIVNKSLTISGENRDNTIIDANDMSHVIEITANNVQISGFTLRDTALDSAGIKILSDDNIISDNTITECGEGVYLSDSVNCKIENNKFYGNNRGIYLDFSSNNNIKNNNIVGNNDGIASFQSYNNQFQNNRVNNNNFEGILNIYSNNNVYDGNTIEENNEHGMQILSSINNNVINNDFDDNSKDAITAGNSNENLFKSNSIKKSPNGLSLFYDSNNNNIVANEFLNNNENGIILRQSSNNTIYNNVIKESNNNALYICVMSVNNSIDSNVFHHCDNFGFLIDYANNENVVNNNFYQCSLSILNTQGNNIESNYIDDKPLVYLEDESNQIIQDAGQIILVNCDNISIDHVVLSSIPIGIEIVSSEQCTIKNCEIHDISSYGCYVHKDSKDICISNSVFENNMMGIYLYETSQKISIHTNSFSQNDQSILLEKSIDNTIFLNTFMNNKESGLSLSSQSKWNKVYDNQFSNHQQGCLVISAQSDFNNISNNTMTNNNNGIRIISSSSNIIKHNQISDNDEFGIYVSGDGQQNIIENTITYNQNGIKLINCNSNNIEINIINYQSQDGIYCSNSDDNYLFSNELANNENGIYLNNCLDATVEYNTISYNKEAGIAEYFFNEYPMLNKNEISKNNFYDNKKQGYFRSSQFGIIIGYLKYFANNNENWDKNYWDDLYEQDSKIIKGDMFVYRDIFSVPIWIKDQFPLSSPSNYEPPSTIPEIKRSVLTRSVQGYNDYDMATNRFQFGEKIYSYCEMVNAKNGDNVKWEWYHNDKLHHTEGYTLDNEGIIAFWSSWTPDEIGEWHIKIYLNEQHHASSPSFTIYKKSALLEYSVLTDWVQESNPEPIIPKPSNLFKKGEKVYSYNKMTNAQSGDMITWEWYHNNEKKYSYSEDIPYNGAVNFWDDWTPDETGSWYIRILLNNELFGYSPEFYVENSIDKYRLGLGDAMTCKWIDENEGYGGPMEIKSGVNETMHCFASFTSRGGYNWRNDKFGYKWYHNDKIIFEGEDICEVDYNGIIRVYFSVENLPEGTGIIELFVNGNLIGRTNPYQVIDGYYDVTSIAGLCEALTCNYAHSINNHGPFKICYNTDETVFFYTSYNTDSYNWLNDKFGYKWYHNGDMIVENHTYWDSVYSGTLALTDSQSKLPSGSGYIELYWNREYLGKTNEYTVS